MNYDRYRGHGYAGYVVTGSRHETVAGQWVEIRRHFGGGSAPKPPAPPPPPPDPPASTDPEAEKAKAKSRADVRARRGRRATILTGGDLEEPATVRGSLVAPGSVSKLGGA